MFYAQYAHARLCSVLTLGKDYEIDQKCEKLSAQSEVDLLKHLASFGEVVNIASNERAPYKVSNYIHELAEKVHAFYTECRVIDSENKEVTSSRLAICLASKIVLKNALNLLGVSAPERM